MKQSDKHKLSSRENELVKAVCTSDRLLEDIAVELKMKPSTANSHLRSVYQKLDLRGRAALTRHFWQTMSRDQAGA